MKKPLAILLAATALTAPACLAGESTRVVTVPLEAEITGLYEHGPDLFLNVQHPKIGLPSPFAKATIGVIANVDWAAGELPVPTDDAGKTIVRSTLGSYQILMQAGDHGIVGAIRTIAGEGLFVSNRPDFNAFVATGGNDGYLFTAWESRPGAMSRARLTRAADGTWTADRNGVAMIDFAPVRGTWVNCFGTLSPWGTPLSSEELLFDDTGDWNDAGHRQHYGPAALAMYLGTYPNPYDYGYIVEITEPAGTPTPIKHYAMGRFSHENAVVMPERRTVYLSDDGNGTVFFKFIADTAGDLGAGTLYAARITQQGPAGAAAAETALTISWIELAHGTNDEIAGWIRQYDGIGTADHVDGATSYVTEAEITAWAAGNAADDRVAFLESRRAAAAKGATAEFRKMEGVNINHAGAADGSVPWLYLAMSEISKTMADGKGDIDLATNNCGAVYRMKLDADFNVANMVPVIAGHGYDRANAPNACPVASLANPDNLIVLRDGTLVVGEDSDRHENNALWIWRE